MTTHWDISDETSARRSIVRVCVRLRDAGLIAGVAGNVSVRLSNGLVLMTPAGGFKDELSPDALIRLDSQGHLLDAGARPSSEYRMHMAALRVRPTIAAVVHAHPPTATGVGTAAGGAVFGVTAEGAALGEVAIVPYARPGTDELAALVADAAPQCEVMILQHHGALTLGGDLASALARMESLEHVARVYVAGIASGRTAQLPSEEQREIARRSRRDIDRD